MKFCWHDWETINTMTEGEIRAEIEFEDSPVSVCRGIPYYVKKVCLKCKKRVDTITPMMKKIKCEYEEKEGRKERALKLWRDG